MIDSRGFHIDNDKIFNSGMIKSFSRKQRIDEQKRKESMEFVKTEGFIKWLTDYVNKYGYISDSPSFPAHIETKEDLDNIKKISYFYMFVDNYASKNYYPSDEAYNFKYEDNIYEIKLFMGQGGMCIIRENNGAEDFIKYEDLVSNKENDRTERISKELDNYKKYLLNLLDENIPEYALQDTFNSTIKEYEIKKEKVLKK